MIVRNVIFSPKTRLIIQSILQVGNSMIRPE